MKVLTATTSLSDSSDLKVSGIDRFIKKWIWQAIIGYSMYYSSRKALFLANFNIRPCLVPKNWEELESNLIMKWEAPSRYWFQFMGSKQVLRDTLLHCPHNFSHNMLVNFIWHVQTLLGFEWFHDITTCCLTQVLFISHFHNSHQDNNYKKQYRHMWHITESLVGEMGIQAQKKAQFMSLQPRNKLNEPISSNI